LHTQSIRGTRAVRLKFKVRKERKVFYEIELNGTEILDEKKIKILKDYSYLREKE
jgi:fructose-1-phosphate kinase PfkB-like protein